MSQKGLIHIIPVIIVVALVGAVIYVVSSRQMTPPTPLSTPGAVRSSTSSGFHVNNQDPNCSDTGAGTQTQPFCTITKAVAFAPASSTINVHTGTYREGVMITKNNLTIQGAPGETPPTIKGSNIVTGWTKEPTQNVWTRVGPVPQGTIRPPIISGYQICNEGKPLCRFPYQVFIDGQQLTLVATTTAVTPGPGEFTYIPLNEQNPSGTNIWRIGTDPIGRTIEISVRRRFIEGNGLAATVTIRGLNFQHSSTGVQEDSITLGPSWVFENNDISLITGSGLALRDYAIARNNHIHNGEGQFGVIGSGVRTRVEGNEIDHMNFRGWHNFNFGAGGVYSVGATQEQVVNNVIHDNIGYGSNCDIGCSGALFEGNRVYGNTVAGMLYEISSGGTIRNNIVYDNGGPGVILSNAANTSANSNIVVRNRYTNISLLQDNRGTEFPNTKSNVIQNNTLIGQSMGPSLVAVTDNNNFGVITKNTTDRNSVYNVDPTWYSWGGAYGSPSAFCTAQGQECNSTVLTATQVNQILTANNIPLTAPTKSQSQTDIHTTPPRSDTASLALNTRIRVAENVAVRRAPAGERIGAQLTGVQGIIIGGPITKGGHRWWKVNYDRGEDGWSAEPRLKPL